MFIVRSRNVPVKGADGEALPLEKPPSGARQSEVLRRLKPPSLITPPLFAIIRDFSTVSGLRSGFLLPIGHGFRFFTLKGAPALDDCVEHLKLMLFVEVPSGFVGGLGLRVGYFNYMEYPHGISAPEYATSDRELVDAAP